MNSTQQIGRLCADPTLKYLGTSHRPLCEFILAVEKRGAVVDPATGKRPCYFFPVKVWGLKAETTAARLAKGQRVAIAGELSQEKFTPKGTDHEIVKTIILADSIIPLDKSHTAPTA